MTKIFLTFLIITLYLPHSQIFSVVHSSAWIGFVDSINNNIDVKPMSIIALNKIFKKLRR